jgi:hypothetical protein
MGVEGRTYLLKRILDTKSYSLDFLRLAHAMDPAQGLLFDHGVPLGLEEVGARSGGKIKAVDMLVICNQDELEKSRTRSRRRL